MLDLLWLVPALPLAGFLLLTLFGNRLARPLVAGIGAGSVGLSAGVAFLVGGAFLITPPPGQLYTQQFWTWIEVATFRPEIAFHLDALSLVMVLVVTAVGFLIHLYAIPYMKEEDMTDEAGYSRFFAAMNLFVAMMLILLLADNLLLLYLGWEGVGLCSYLLIGFWYRDPANGQAARKAFIVTRVGDTALAIGLFLLFANLGTLHIQTLMQQAGETWTVGSDVAVAAAALLLGGAVGKSAQLPLQTWLPDAMAGPTPVSALIHAATMVTAGVYLIARTHVLFSLAPSVLLVVALIGAVTLLLAGCSALVQRDIKRVLAYSTISQIGYMFLALGVGAWSAAIFHFMTHAFFKALLFLGAGVIIWALHHEQDMFKMGGLRRQLPLTFWTFLIGTASLAALPLVTAGFYSKDLILLEVWSAPNGGVWLWLAGLIGALLTALYAFRMLFLTFFGPANRQAEERPGWLLRLPLLLLAGLSLLGGFVELPQTLGGLHLFSDFMQTAFMQTALPGGAETYPALTTELILQLVASLSALAGLGIAYFFYYRRPDLPARLADSGAGTFLHRLWVAGWGFDGLYQTLFVRPYVWLAHLNRADLIDAVPNGLARLSEAGHQLLSRSQSGEVRRYALGIALGAAITITLVVWL